MAQIELYRLKWTKIVLDVYSVAIRNYIYCSMTISTNIEVTCSTIYSIHCVHMHTCTS